MKRNLKKFLIVAIVSASTLLPTFAFAETQKTINVIFGKIRVFVNGASVNKETLLYEGTTYIPLRATAEALKKQLIFDPNTNTAYINNIYTEYPESSSPVINQIRHETIVAYFDRIKLIVDGVKSNKETLLYNGSTYIPLRDTAELLKMQVSYDGATSSAKITDGNGSSSPQPINAKLAYYANFPTILDLGTYAGVSLVKSSAINNGAEYCYQKTLVPFEKFNGYLGELVKLGFLLNNELSSNGYYFYSKGSISISIDIRSAEHIVISIQNTNTTTVSIAMYQEYPLIPDIGSFVGAKINAFKTTTEYDGSKAYWYKNISAEVIQTYVNELLRLGYVMDKSLSKTNYYVYTKADISLIVDAATYRYDNTVLVNIKSVTSETYSYYSEYPSVPVFANTQPVSSYLTDDGIGTVFRYGRFDNSVVQNYIKTLTGLGYVLVGNMSYDNYFVYYKDTIQITIDLTTLKSDGGILIIVKKIKSLDSTGSKNDFIAYTQFPGVPDYGAFLNPYKSAFDVATTADGFIVYHYGRPTNSNSVQNYRSKLESLQYLYNSNDSKSNYHVYQKGNTIAIVDLTDSDGFVSIKIK